MLDLPSGNYVIGDITSHTINPDWSTPVNNGVYRDTYGVTYKIENGVFGLVNFINTSNPNQYEGIIKNNCCCAPDQITSQHFLLAWKNDLHVIHYRTTFGCESLIDDDGTLIKIGHCRIRRVSS